MTDRETIQTDRQYPSITVDPEAYDVQTIIPYVDGAEVTNYLIPADELTEFYTEMNDASHAEEIVSIDPIGDENAEYVGFTEGGE
jgi:hypothetical protein